jgi:hypothetical protein
MSETAEYFPLSLIQTYKAAGDNSIYTVCL